MKRHMGLVLLAGLLLSSLTVAAPPFNGGFGCFGPTVGIVNFDSLSNAFSEGGVVLNKKPSSLQWGFGGAGFALIDRVVIGGSGWGSSQTVGSSDLRATIAIAGGEFDLGYQVYSLKHLLIAPVLGIGGGGYTIVLQDTSGAPTNFPQLLENPGRTSKISFSGLTLSPQLLVTVPISFVGFQLRGGYCYTPVNPEWGLEGGSNMFDGPAISKGMPFVTLNVVFGGFEGGIRRHKSRKQ
jgi:hypothetical protein